AVGAVVGTVVAVGAQAYQDYKTGTRSGLDKYAAAASGGFVGGAIVGLTDGASLLGTIGYGAVAGTANAVTHGGGQEGISSVGGNYKFNWSNVFAQAPESAFFGAIPGLDLLPGLNTRGALMPLVRQLLTKLDKGIIKNLSAESIIKVYGAGFLTQVPGQV